MRNNTSTFLLFFFLGACAVDPCINANMPRVLDFIRNGEEGQEDNFRRCRDRMIRSAIEEFYSEIKADSMALIGIGGGVNHDNGKENYIKISLQRKAAFTVDCARGFIVPYAKRFLEILNNKEGIQNYIDVYPFDMSHFCMSILSQENPDEESCIDMISASENMIYYRFSNAPGKPPILIHEETFEEAQRIVAEQKQTE